MQWDSTFLLNKAKLFAQYANDVDRGSALYGFWNSLYLEILARAALAKLHPSLLADPQDSRNILYGFGVALPKGEPTSIQTKAVYQRCAALVEGFDDQALSHCLIMARARNIELHSSEAVFETMTHNRWQLEQFRVVSILSRHLAAAVADFFDDTEIAELTERLNSQTKEMEGRAKALIETHRKWFHSLSATDQLAERNNAENQILELLIGETYYSRSECPACSSKGIMSGDKLLNSKITIDDELLTKRSVFSAKRFVCKVCKLDLNRESLSAAQLPISFSITEEVDPVEHFGIDPSDYMDQDEMIRQLERSGIHVYQPEYDNE